MKNGYLVVAAIALATAGCTPDWAQQNDSPFVMEIASITGAGGTNPILSDVGLPVTNDNAVVAVNIWRKNNNPGLGTSPAEHIFLKRYEIRYLRTDGRNVEGLDVPHRVSGALGNLRFHTPGPGGDGEVELSVTIPIVRHQAKIEPPLANLHDSTGAGETLVPFPQAAVLTIIAEVTIHAETVQGKALQASGFTEIIFSDFPNAAQ